MTFTAWGYGIFYIHNDRVQIIAISESCLNPYLSSQWSFVWGLIRGFLWMSCQQLVFPSSFKCWKLIQMKPHTRPCTKLHWQERQGFILRYKRRSLGPPKCSLCCNFIKWDWVKCSVHILRCPWLDSRDSSTWLKCIIALHFNLLERLQSF